MITGLKIREDKNIDLDFILKDLKVITNLGRKKIKEIVFLKEEKKIKEELDATEYMTFFYRQNNEIRDELKNLLENIKDIEGTLQKLNKKTILDDIELFEIKNFAFWVEHLNIILNKYLKNFELPSLKDVFTILDPEGYGINSFYIYDIYDLRLVKIRQEKRKLAKEISFTKKDKRNQFLIIEEEEIEKAVREKLTQKLSCFFKQLLKALKGVADLDVLLAKAEQNERWGLVKPVIVEEEGIACNGLFNPLVQENLKEKGDKFQAVDISLKKGVTLLTGANMSGKTVLLRALALAQEMFQRGFFVPAKTANLSIKDKVFLLIGDNQSCEAGLSSYAAEIIYVSQVIDFIEKKGKALILLDELARSTNPNEGMAIVKAVVEILKKEESISLITTHYNDIGKNLKVNSLRVAGLKKECLPERLSSLNELRALIDYSLIEENKECSVPQDALLIAKLLQVNESLLRETKKIIDN